MARKARVHYKSAIYHVIARGNNKEQIYLDDADKEKYSELLYKYQQRYRFELFAFVIMDNHVHMIIRVDEVPLAGIMQGVQQSYTQYFNRKYRHVGHVFQQRYKAFLCNADSYLVTLVCYIHQNPCRAGLAQGLNFYWSSHNDYIRGRGSIANPGFVLGMLNESRQAAIEQYIRLVQDDTAKMYSGVICSPAAEEILIQGSARNTPTEENKRGQRTFGELANEIAAEKDIDIGQLVGRCRVRKVVEARNVLIYRVIEEKIYTKKQLAVKLQVDPAVITRGLQKEARRCKEGDKSND